MTEKRQRKTPLRVRVGPLPAYRRGDRLRDVAGVGWAVVHVDGEHVTVRTPGGACEITRTAAQLADWRRE